MLLQLCTIWSGGIFVLQDFPPGLFLGFFGGLVGVFLLVFFPILIKAKSCTLPGFLVAGSVYIGSRSSTGSDDVIYPLIHLFCR